MTRFEQSIIAVLSLALGLLFTACITKPQYPTGDDDSADGGCFPGQTAPCECNCTGWSTMTCTEEGEWGYCDCGGWGGRGDDDDTPDYEGCIDMENALLEASCTIEDEATPESPEGSGTFEFFIEIEGWAAVDPPCWVEFFDMTSDYCEGYDADTGDPCTFEDGDVVRPGWEMVNADAGLDYETGYWDQWELILDYHGGNVWPPDPDATLFLCENAGNNFETWFCCCDLAEGDFCDCTMFPLEAW